MAVLGEISAAGAQERQAAFETSAKQAILFDFSTQAVLFERNADQKIAPGALAKIMTAALVFRELRESRLKLEDDMVVSADAWRRGGAVSGQANMLLTPGKIVKVGDLLTGIAVGAANDAALTLAENIAGTEARFAAMMTQHARALGLTSLEFRNATGYAHEEQSASLRDLVALAAHIIVSYPDYYALFGQRDMPLGKNRQTSRNPLLAMEIGADGLMVASLPETGHALIGSAIQDGRRLIVGVAGHETVQERALEARKLLEWGFRRFETRTLFEAGEALGEVALYGAAQTSVTVITREAIRLPVLRGSNEGTRLQLVYQGPVPAPVAEGAEIARLRVIIDGRRIREAPLFAARAVPKGSVTIRARDASLELMRQWAGRGWQWLLEKAGLASKPAEEAPLPRAAGAA